MRSKMCWVVALMVSGMVGIGCQQESAPSKPAKASTAPAANALPAAKAPAETGDEVQTTRAKLSPEDQALVKAQEWCVISSEERLGSMGAPIKLDIKGQPVFVCCKSCKKSAEADPDKTLAKLAELKAKAAAAQTR